jgi:hypothetical protein
MKIDSDRSKFQVRIQNPYKYIRWETIKPQLDWTTEKELFTETVNKNVLVRVAVPGIILRFLECDGLNWFMGSAIRAAVLRLNHNSICVHKKKYWINSLTFLREYQDDVL